MSLKNPGLEYLAGNPRTAISTIRFLSNFLSALETTRCFLKDLATGSELINEASTEAGFRLDLVKSRYLDIDLKRETLNAGADGLVEDTRFNRPARDGSEHAGEGVYTITVRNRYNLESSRQDWFTAPRNPGDDKH